MMIEFKLIFLWSFEDIHKKNVFFFNKKSNKYNLINNINKPK